MTIPTLTSDGVKRVRDLIQEGCNVKDDVASLNEGLKETVKSVSEELGIPAKILNKAIATAHKANFQDLESELEDLDQLLEITKIK